MSKLITLDNLRDFKTNYDAYVQDEISKAAFSSGYTYKGSKTVAQLNAIAAASPAPSAGDTYNLTDSGTLSAGSVVVSVGDNVAWTGTAWNKLAGVVDLSGYATQSWVTNQGYLTSSDLSSYATKTYVQTELSDYVTTQDLTTSLNSYLPLSAGNTNALTGDLYLGSHKLWLTAGLEIETSTINTNDVAIYFVSDGKYRFYGDNGDAILDAGSLTANRTINFPNESGTLIVGELATQSDINSLFN